MKEFVDYRGERFYLQSTGRYYQSGRKDVRERLLHSRVWSDENGPIPDGCEIHHKDENWRNNELQNLELVNGVDHQREHMLKKMQDPEFRERSIQHLRSGSAAAADWHRSDAGRDWHARHAVEGWKDRKPKSACCEVCGLQYETFFPTRSRFCSMSCEQKDHYLRHKTATKLCSNCGTEFTFNKYRKQECCSRACANKMRGQLEREKE